tara:strand:- start:280 stop:594 length:315 start_codon:yes stop_codon:yes gene_type:complete
MENNISELENICGLKPVDVEFILVGNNPNFIYQNDANYLVKILYDLDGNIINVNSWLECANYAAGGWSNIIPGTVNWEKNIFILYSLLTITYLMKNKIRDFFIR